MSSLNDVSISTKPKTKKILMPKGGRLWHLLKFIECTLVVSCLLTLILTQYLHVIVDDFTQVSNESSEDSSNQTKLRDEQLGSELLNGHTFPRVNRDLRRVKKVSDKEELGNHTKDKHSSISLNYLLIMFPCSTTLFMVIAMEVFGEIFKDPLSKLSILILIFLAILLAITLLAISSLSSLRSICVTSVMTSIFSAALIVVEFTNFILILLS